MRISPINFKSSLISYRNQTINPDNVEKYSKLKYENFDKTCVRFSSGRTENIDVPYEIFEQAMIQAKNENDIVDLSDYVKS